MTFSVSLARFLFPFPFSLFSLVNVPYDNGNQRYHTNTGAGVYHETYLFFVLVISAQVVAVECNETFSFSFSFSYSYSYFFFFLFSRLVFDQRLKCDYVIIPNTPSRWNLYMKSTSLH